MMHVTIVASPSSPDVEVPSPGSTPASDFVWLDEAACGAMAHRLCDAITPDLSGGGSAIIELHGTLGAGKTTFTRHLLRAMGVNGRIKSPSYAVVEPHEPPVAPVYHFDFYRFNDPQEWEDAGFRDLFASPGLKLVEWPDKAAGLLPLPDWEVHIQPLTGDERQVRVVARTAQGQGWLSVMDASSDSNAKPGGPAHGQA